MQSALNRQALHGEVNPLFKKFVHEGAQPTTYIPADKRLEIYQYMSQVNYNKHHETNKPETSTMKDAQKMTAVQRTDYSVGVEGNRNKAFQAQQQIGLGHADVSHRLRDTNNSIGPTETRTAYQTTSNYRNQNRQKVYSVNIPFSGSPGKPGSAAGGKKQQQLVMSPEEALSKSHANTFMSNSTRNSVTGRTDTEAVLARKQNAATIANSSVKMKFPENSPYNVGKSQKEFKPTQNRKELLHNAKKAEFQGQLLNSSVRFTHDQNNNRMSYNNCAGGGADKDLIYNIKSARPQMSQAEAFDKQSKNHLITMASATDKRYQTISDQHFNTAKPSMNQKDVEQLRNHYKFHKGTTYSIGNERGRAASVTNAQESFVAKQRQEAADIQPGRRNQEKMGIHNQNKVKNYMIGQDTPSVRGGDLSVNVHKRSNSTYNQSIKGAFTTQFSEANDKNKDQRNFINSNKFEYGYDPSGGSNVVSPERNIGTPKKPFGQLTQEHSAYKPQARDTQQNFKIQPQQRLQNSETKRVGDTLDRFVRNEIDQMDLKRSHLPFANVVQKIQETQRPQMNSSGFGFKPTQTTTGGSTAFKNYLPTRGTPQKDAAPKQLSMHFKTFSESGNVPFGAARINKREEANSRNPSTVTSETFKWHVPTVMK